jgi:hypothetical protein
MIVEPSNHGYQVRINHLAMVSNERVNEIKKTNPKFQQISSHYPLHWFLPVLLIQISKCKQDGSFPQYLQEFISAHQHQFSKLLSVVNLILF